MGQYKNGENITADGECKVERRGGVALLAWPPLPPLSGWCLAGGPGDGTVRVGFPAPYIIIYFPPHML